MAPIKILSVESYRTRQRDIKKDRIKVVVDMPIGEFTEFRKRIEGPHLYPVHKGDKDGLERKDS